MNKEELVREIKDALEDVIVFQNRRNSNTLIVSLSNKLKDMGVVSDDVAGVEVQYSHLDLDKKFRILERTSRGTTVVK